MKIFFLYFVLFYLNCIEAACPFGQVESDNQCFECGRVPIQPNVKIVGGIEAVANSYPSQVYIEKKMVGIAKYKNDKGVWVTKKVDETEGCGGTLINKYTILTAAHCTAISIDVNNEDVPVELDKTQFPTVVSTLTVYLGAHDIGFINDENIPKPSSVVIAKVAKIIDHPFYNIKKNTENDISLLILTKPVQYTQQISPACLPEKRSSSYPGLDVFGYVSGWGALQQDGKAVDKLYNVKLRIRNTGDCSKTSSELKKNWLQQLCAGSMSSNRDTCQGDSGGGLYYDSVIGASEKRIVVGVVSYGEGCGKKIPAIYTRVSYYLDWIKSNWKSNEDYDYI